MIFDRHANLKYKYETDTFGVEAKPNKVLSCFLLYL